MGRRGNLQSYPNQQHTLNSLVQLHVRLARYLIGGGKDVPGDNAEAAVAVVHEPIPGMAAERRDPIGQLDLEGFLKLQR